MAVWGLPLAQTDPRRSRSPARRAIRWSLGAAQLRLHDGSDHVEDLLIERQPDGRFAATVAGISHLKKTPLLVASASPPTTGFFSSTPSWTGPAASTT